MKAFSESNLKQVVIVGAGPAGLFIAYKLLECGFKVSLFEKTGFVGKKFLVAGKSDLNLTNNEPIETFSKKYFENEKYFKDLLVDFSPSDLQNWFKELGVDCFIGSSDRIFPKNIKAAQILKKWMSKLIDMGLDFRPYHELVGVNQDFITFKDNKDEVVKKIEADYYVYALGGASWKITGSDGSWINSFAELGIKTNKFESSNCGINLTYSTFFKDNFPFSILKNVKASCGNLSIQGDITCSSYGLEGTPIYSIISEVRRGNTLTLNFKPDLSISNIKDRVLKRKKKQSLSSFLRKELNLTKGIYSFMREFYSQDEIESNLPVYLSSFVVPVESIRPIDEAISTIGGISLNEVDSGLMLKKLHNHYLAGEMLDWDTITGGYLLQGCFSMAYRVFTSIDNSEKNICFKN